MKLQLVGCSHHNAPVDVREQLAFSHHQAREAIERFRIAYPSAEMVLLSTCNRTELYTAALDPDAKPTLDDCVHFLAKQRELDYEVLSPTLVRHHGLDAVRHLFRVTSSLDSMVVGEAQILSQVKSAYEQSSELYESMPVLNTVFQHALKVAKRISTETAIQQKRVSIPSVAVSDFARQIFEHFDDKRVLVVGAGEMAEETMTYLRDIGVRQIVVINRSLERAQALAETWNAESRPWDQLLETVVEVDIIVTATGASEPIIDSDAYKKIERQRSQKTLFILDLAVPRDIDAKIGDCLGVYLFTVDDLKEVCDSNREARLKELPKADKIVEQEADRFQADWNVRSSGLTIKQLRSMANDIKTIEYERLVSKLNGLDDRSRREIEMTMDRLVNKILHPPLESLRSEAKQGTHSSLMMALKRLFQLED